MPAVRNLVLIVTALAVLGVVFYFAAATPDVVMPPTKAPAAKPKPPTPRAKALPAAKETPLPPLRLNPKPLADRRAKLAAKDAAASSKELLGLPRDLVKQKLREAAGQAPEPKKATVRKEDVQAAVKVARPGIKACFEQALLRNPQLGGRLKVKFTLVTKDGVGKLNDAEIVGDEEEGALNHPFMAMCALKALADVEYPAPEGEGELTVTYPFIFAAAQSPDAGQ